MYTQCPECKKPHSLTIDELRKSHGMLRCKTCSAMFDALELLSKGSIPNSVEIELPPPNVTLAGNNVGSQKMYWNLGVIFLLLLLMFQIYFFESYNMTQNQTLRPWLKKACTVIPGCRFPHYKNLNELTILEGAFEPVNDYYVFKTTIINQSIFSQKRPSIKLILIDFTGNAFADRIFQPEEYSKRPLTLLEPNVSNEILFTIAAPSDKVGGYHFELI